jgi:hypothetical protein
MGRQCYAFQNIERTACTEKEGDRRNGEVEEGMLPIMIF